MIRALRSERQSIPRLSEASDLSVGTVHKLTRPSTIASVGYEGRSIDQVIEALVASHVGVLVDVRENAISRKPGLSKRALAARCEAHGIDYVHERTLGNPRDNRDGFRTGLPSSIEVYERHLVKDGADALGRVAELLKDRTVGLLCFEADPCACHRSIVAEHLKGLDPLASVQPV
jgi:uncharacterized protein (DUF488 family)